MRRSLWLAVLLAWRPALAAAAPAAVERRSVSAVELSAPALETAPDQLPSGVQAKLEPLFGADQQVTGEWRGQPPAPQPPSAVLPPALAADLAVAGRLGESDRRRLFSRLRQTDLRVRGPPDFGPDHTFSFELEFLVNRQLQKMDLDALFENEPLTRREKRDFREKLKLPRERWVDAADLVAGRVIERMPEGWRLFNVGKGNTLELNTGNRGGKYHKLTPSDWADLTASLERVQSVLPAGLYSVHLHNGYEPLRDGGRLDVDVDRFARLAKVYEAMWRALSGLGYRAPAEPKDGSDNQITYLGLDALSPGQEYSTMEKEFIGLSDDFPTIESRGITGLLRDGRGGPQRLDPQALAGDVWWTFALMRALAGKDAFELATLGLPATAGLVPTRKQLVHFADRLYGGDLVGKALALKRLAEVRFGGGRPMSARRRRTARRAIARQYDELGLAVVYRLHARADGIDERLVDRLRADPRLLGRLAGDLAEIYSGDEEPLSFFPESFHGELTDALARARQERAWTVVLGRGLKSAWRAFKGFWG